jgi:hypothetical protein
VTNADPADLQRFANSGVAWASRHATVSGKEDNPGGAPSGGLVRKQHHKNCHCRMKCSR